MFGHSNFAGYLASAKAVLECSPSSSRLALVVLNINRHTYKVLKRFEHLVTQPHGIILVTGPTGSGKTTTLYAALSRLDAAGSNIMTVEDPIEYELAGVGQTQVNAKIELTFAKALRAILRQDPDVIMIGEIRDFETAQKLIDYRPTNGPFKTIEELKHVSGIGDAKFAALKPYVTVQ